MYDPAFIHVRSRACILSLLETPTHHQPLRIIPAPIPRRQVTLPAPISPHPAPVCSALARARMRSARWWSPVPRGSAHRAWVEGSRHRRPDVTIRARVSVTATEGRSRPGGGGSSGAAALRRRGGAELAIVSAEDVRVFTVKPTSRAPLS